MAGRAGTKGVKAYNDMTAAGGRLRPTLYDSPPPGRHRRRRIAPKTK
jgi:hypothetical protein